MNNNNNNNNTTTNISSFDVLRLAIRRVGRKRVARAIGMKYGTLGPKLNGNNPLTPEEEGSIWGVLKELGGENHESQHPSL